ncbi:MAG: TVP38/TMEM64 family protein [Thermodesulfobacteriota bacterium]|jgi:uncharacterized membrane protein YdjX (TVP38/TMEM64 family)|nr:MAG: TVP38/TMEM64 family protein [Thermodesulfobacteriota bacterium]
MHKRIILLIAFVALIVFLRFTTLPEPLTFENLQHHKNFFQNFAAGNYLLSVGMFVVIYILVAGLSLPGATILTMGGGFVFGAFMGAVYVNIGATIGALVAFLSSRYLAGTWIQNKYQEKLCRFNQEVAQHGPHYLLTLRFIPLFPFFLINLFAGLTKIPVKTFIWTTSLGIFPGSLVYSFAGSQLTKITSVKDVLSIRILLAFCVLGLFILAPRLLTAIKKKYSAGGHGE